MDEQTIKPVLPINRTRDVIKKKKNAPKNSPPKSHPEDKKPGEKKGIIDTYA